MDVAGRVSRTTEGFEYATVGGFALETAKIGKLRKILPKNLPKLTLGSDHGRTPLTKA
jgi:hypothetical protein